MINFFAGCFDGMELSCGVEDGAVERLSFGKRDPTPDPPPEAVRLWKQVEEELAKYFAGERRAFDLPLRFSGTEFQRLVWEELLKIPYGETRSYGEIVSLIGRPGAARAVGAACHANPICILIPCHRIVGASGALTGFGGGLWAKKRLLTLEGAEFSG